MTVVELLLSMELNQYCCIALKLNLLPLCEIPRTLQELLCLFGHGGKKRKRTPKPLNQKGKNPHNCYNT